MQVLKKLSRNKRHRLIKAVIDQLGPEMCSDFLNRKSIFRHKSQHIHEILNTFRWANTSEGWKYWQKTLSKSKG